MTHKVRMLLFLMAAVTAIVASVFAAADVQRATAERSFAE